MYFELNLEVSGDEYNYGKATGRATLKLRTPIQSMDAGESGRVKSLFETSIDGLIDSAVNQYIKNLKKEQEEKADREREEKEHECAAV
jgi:hypothetical protein